MGSNVNILRALSGQDNIYTIPKLYVQLTGCHVRALVLNQLIFFSDKSTRHVDNWFDKKFKKWHEETLIKERTLRNIFREFEAKGWCETKIVVIDGETSLACRPFIENILDDINYLLKNEQNMSGKFCRTSKEDRKILPEGSENFADPSITYNYTDNLYRENETPVDNFPSQEPESEYTESAANPVDNNYPETYYPSCPVAKPEESTELAVLKSSGFNVTQYDLDGFEAFFTLYPRGGQKEQTRLQWFHDRCHERAHEIIAKLQEQMERDKQFLDGYAPSAYNYIVKKCYENKIYEGKKTGIGGFKQNDTSWANKENFNMLDNF